jgi:DNA-binding CsgD family transcriptional regulator
MEPTMTAFQFICWLSEMKASGLARSDAECARQLGVSANSVVTMKKHGADLRTALACRALLHRMEPYS